MALSMSVSAGAHNARHNTDLAYRANLRNVDADLQNLMMSELEKAAAAHGIERRLMDCDRKHLDVPEYQQAMRDYNELTDRIEQKRSRVAELDRDIEGKERTVARLDRSIETKTKRLASELDGRFY